VLFTVLTFVGFGVGGGPGVTLGDTSSKILKAYDHPMGNGVWVGSYLTFLGLAAFAVFAAWLFNSRRNLQSRTGLLVAAAYVGLILVNLAASAVLNYRAGHGMSSDQTLALFYLQDFLFIASWGASAGFLALVPVDGWLRRTALGLAALILVAMAVPKAGIAQFPPTLFYIWTLVAGVALARRRGHAVAGSTAAAASA
jgi:hypothetical protein